MGNLCSAGQPDVDQPVTSSRSVPDGSSRRAPNGQSVPSLEDLIAEVSSPDDATRQQALVHVADLLQNGNKVVAMELASRGLYSHLANSMSAEQKREVLPALKATWHLSQNADTHEAAAKSSVARALMAKLTSESNGQKASAAQSLQNLLRNATLQAAVAENGHLYAILLPGLRAAETEPVQREFSVLLVDAARFPTASKEFATEGNVLALLSLTLSEGPGNPRVREAAAEALALLLHANPTALSYLTQGDRLQRVCRAAKMDAPFVQEQALKLLQLLALAEKQQWLLQQGVLPLLCDLLPRSEAEVEAGSGPVQRVWAEVCQTLCELCAGQASIKKAIVEEQVIPPMLYCLRCTHSAVRASVCRALYSVLVVDEAKDEVYNNGGIPMILEVMDMAGAGPDEVENATTAIRNLCYNHRLAAKAVVQLGGVRPLVHVLERGDESEAQKQALAATINLLATLASPEERQEQDVYVDLCENGGVQALTNLIHMGVSGEVSDGKQWMGWAAQALSYIAGHPQCERYVLKALKQQAIEEAEASGGTVLEQVKETLEQLAEEADPAFL